MNGLSAAIHARLAADPALSALVATYLGVPAVFVADEDTVPERAVMPLVVITGPSFDEPNDTKDADGREVEVVIRAYTDATGSTAAIGAIAERIRHLLHRQPAGLADGAYLARCSGPTVAPTDSSLYGREVLVRVTTLTCPTSEEES